MQNSEMTFNFNGYRLAWVFGQGTPDLRTELIRFWMTNNAVPDPYEAWRRSFEVTCTARDDSGDLVGVSSFYLDRLLTDGLPYCFYRTYVRPDCRIMGLAPRLFLITFDKLAALYAGETYSPSGIVVVTENPKLEEAAGLRIIQRCGLERLGANPQGVSVWRRLFLTNPL